MKWQYFCCFNCWVCLLSPQRLCWPTWKKASSADWNRGLPPACWRVLVHLVRKLSSKCLLRRAEQLLSKGIGVSIAHHSARIETSVTSCATSLSQYLCISAPSPTTALLLFTRWAECFHVFKFLRFVKNKSGLQEDSQKAPNEWSWNYFVFFFLCVVSLFFSSKRQK